MSGTYLFLDKTKSDWLIIAGVYAIFISLIALNKARNGEINQRFCLIPRRNFGWARWALHPFLHGDISHLWSNTPGFFILGWLTMFPNRVDFFITTGMTIGVEGALTWLFGKSGTGHVGSSSLVMGYFGFLLTRMFFSRDMGQAIFGLFIALFFYQQFRYLTLRGEGISLAGHFFGFIGGILAGPATTLLPASSFWSVNVFN